MKRLSLLGIAVFVALVSPARAQTAHAAPLPAATDNAANQTEKQRDPWEHANRRAYAFGRFIDHFAFRPLAMCYRRWLPHQIRAGIANFITNLDEPEVGVNDLLQGKPRQAGVAVLRFGLNTTIGVVGIFDLARQAGLPHHDNDAGITLAHYGVTSGPYLFIPLAGPSSVRDAVGAGADFLLDPLSWVNFKHSDVVFNTVIVAGALQGRADADPELRYLSRTAADPYATMRSYYLQSRDALGHDQRLQIEDLPNIPDAQQPTSPAPAIADASGSIAPLTPTAP